VIRNVIYNLVARNRYRWFGRRDALHPAEFRSFVAIVNRPPLRLPPWRELMRRPCWYQADPSHTGKIPPLRPTPWLGISDSNFDVQRENSSL
jgi:hypothetical protein